MESENAVFRVEGKGILSQCFSSFFRRHGSKKVREMESGMEKSVETQQRALYRNKIALSNHSSGKTVKGKRKTILCNQESEKETRYFFHEKLFCDVFP